MKATKKVTQNLSSKRDKHKALAQYVCLQKNVRQTSQKLGIPLSTLYGWIKHNPDIIKKETEILQKTQTSLNKKQSGLTGIPEANRNNLDEIKDQVLNQMLSIMPDEKDLNKLTNALTAIITLMSKEGEINKSKPNRFLQYIQSRKYINPSEIFLSEEDLKE